MHGLLQATAPPASDSQLWCSRHRSAAHGVRRRPAVLVLALAQPPPRISRDQTPSASTSCQPQQAAHSIDVQRGATAALFNSHARRVEGRCSLLLALSNQPPHYWQVRLTE